MRPRLWLFYWALVAFGIGLLVAGETWVGTILLLLAGAGIWVDWDTGGRPTGRER